MKRDDENFPDIALRSFRQFDVDGDGKISRGELGDVFKCIDSVFWTDARLDDLLEAVDTNGDGNIDYSEFVAWLCAENTEKSENGTDGWEDVRAMATLERRMIFDRSNLIVFEPGEIIDVYRLGHARMRGDGICAYCQALDRNSKLKRFVRSVIKDRCDAEALEEEVRALQTLDHPNIVKLFQVFEDDQRIFLVFDLLDGCVPLDELILRLALDSESQVADVMKQVMRGVNHMHRSEVIHRDIRPKNVVVREEGSVTNRTWTTRISSCEHAMRFTAGMTWTDRIGDLYYMSPQMSAGHPYDHRTDIWSLGVMMYQLLSGYPPFVGEDDIETKFLIRTCALTFPDNGWSQISDHAKDLVSGMLTVDCQARIALQDACNHPWLEISPKKTRWLDMSLLARMTRFGEGKPGGDLRKIALHAFAQQADAEAVKRLRELFESLDQDNDGTVTYVEFREGLEKAYLNLDADSLKTLMENLDADGNTRINYTEFLAATMDLETMDDEAVCRAAFQFLDRDRSGTISTQEITKVLDMGGIASEADIRTIMKQFDANKDGFMDFGEFRALLFGEDPAHVRRRQQKATSVTSPKAKAKGKALRRSTTDPMMGAQPESTDRSRLRSATDAATTVVSKAALKGEPRHR